MEHQLIPYQPHRGAIPAQSVIAFAPHPDDEVFGCGGALALHVQAGVPVRVVVLTDGRRGGTLPPGHDLITAREEECRRAASDLGLAAPEFRRLPDRSLAYGEVLVHLLLDKIEEVRADLVYAPSPTELHPDHRATALSAIEALRRCKRAVRLAFYEVSAPLRPNLLLDISSVWEIKREAMRRFASQLAENAYDRKIEALNLYRTYTLPAEVIAAEAYELIEQDSLARNHIAWLASDYSRLRRLGVPFASPEDCPLVSILTRSMDRPYLAEALGSVALQTYPHIEVVVVNARGGHHREVQDMLDRFPVRLVNQDGRALSRAAAANAGLAAADGRYAMFLDDDDLLLPEHVHKLVLAFREEGARVAYSGVRLENATGQTVKIYDEEWSLERLYGSNFIPIHAVLFDLELYRAGCRFDESLDCVEDWDFWLQLSRHARFLHAPGVSAVYRSGLGKSAVSANFVEEEHLANRARIYAKWRDKLTDRELGGAFYWWSLQREEGFHQAQACKLELEKRNAELQACHAELADLRPAHAGLAAELAALRQTLSWRITAPLRALRRMWVAWAQRGASNHQ